MPEISSHNAQVLERGPSFVVLESLVRETPFWETGHGEIGLIPHSEDGPHDVV